MIVNRIDEDEILEAFSKTLDWPFILIDGHELRSRFKAVAFNYARGKGWLDWGPLHEDDQWAWYNARLTDKGWRAVANFLKRKGAYY